MKPLLPIAALLWSVLLALPAFSDEVEKKTAPQPAQQETESSDEAEEVTDQTLYNEVRTLYRARAFDEAEEKLQAALEKFPDSEALNSLHRTAYNLLSSAERPDDAYRHLEAYVDYWFEQAVEEPSTVGMFSQALGQLMDTTASQNGNESAMEVIDNYANRVNEVDGSTDAAATAVETQRAFLLGKSGKSAEGRAIIDNQIQAATAALDAAPDDAEAIIQMANALNNRLTLETAIDGGKTPEAWSEYSQFLDKQARAYADDQAIVGAFIREHLMRASSLARTSPDDAEAVVSTLKEFQQSVGDEASLSPRLPAQIAQLEKMIRDERRRQELPGSPALLPENVDAWVNGEPRTPESLQGKVVLLDFFAVWCGPCVATFPHLRQWHDDYSSQGLEIVGVSSYYKYGWNDETNRPERGEFTPEEEQAAMEQFVAHHELRHPIVYVTDSALKEHYVVTGIPHVVIIDRQGKVRLFRIGSGEKNAHDVEEAIKECLAE